MSRQLKLGAFLMATGHHVAAWRHPDVPANAGLDFAHYKRLAQIAEAAKFDALFVADSVAAPTQDIASRMARSDHFEPLTLLSALSAVTERIGLIATATTSYNEPYHVARKFASLDHLSGGRAGWNLVTSDNAAEALNFGRDEHIGHAERYSRAREFHQVVTGLWDSWEDDAFIRDKASGEYYNPAKLHVLDHAGEHFRVKGPLNVARSPQGQPVIVQAGASDDGRQLAAETAEAVFTGGGSLADGQKLYADIKGRMEKIGRDPEHPIEFDVEENGSFLNAGNIKKVEGASVTNQAGASSTSGSTDWAAKDRSIAWQAARNSANALLAVGASAGYQDFPDSFTKLLAKSDELTLKFFNSSQNPGGTTEAKKVQKPSPQEDDSDPFHDDTIPF